MTVMMKLTITKSARLDWALHQFFKQHWGFWFVCGTDGFSTSFGLNKLLNKMMIHLQSATHAVIEQQRLATMVILNLVFLTYPYPLNKAWPR